MPRSMDSFRSPESHDSNDASSEVLKNPELSPEDRREISEAIELAVKDGGIATAIPELVKLTPEEIVLKQSTNKPRTLSVRFSDSLKGKLLALSTALTAGTAAAGAILNAGPGYSAPQTYSIERSENASQSIDVKQGAEEFEVTLEDAQEDPKALAGWRRVPGSAPNKVKYIHIGGPLQASESVTIHASVPQDAKNPRLTVQEKNIHDNEVSLQEINGSLVVSTSGAQHDTAPLEHAVTSIEGSSNKNNHGPDWQGRMPLRLTLGRQFGDSATNPTTPKPWALSFAGGYAFSNMTLGELGVMAGINFGHKKLGWNPDQPVLIEGWWQKSGTSYDFHIRPIIQAGLTDPTAGLDAGAHIKLPIHKNSALGLGLDLQIAGARSRDGKGSAERTIITFPHVVVEIPDITSMVGGVGTVAFSGGIGYDPYRQEGLIGAGVSVRPQKK